MKMVHKEVRFGSLPIGAKFYASRKLCVKIANAEYPPDPSYVMWGTGEIAYMGKDCFVRPVKARMCINFYFVKRTSEQ